MRSASSYRAFRKKMAKEAGIPLQTLNRAYDVAARAAEAAPEPEAEDAARKKLAIWAANGGRETAISPPISDMALKRMNEGVLAADLAAADAGEEVPAPPTAEQVADAAKKLTVDDVDKALEKTLTDWQSTGHVEPLQLGTIFAARARQIGWVEDVEFIEVK
jgi:hypothetical protein